MIRGDALGGALVERVRRALLRWLLPAASGPIAVGQRWISADGRTTWTILGTFVDRGGTIKGVVAHAEDGYYMPKLYPFTPEKGPDGWYPEFLGAHLLDPDAPDGVRVPGEVDGG